MVTETRGWMCVVDVGRKQINHERFWLTTLLYHTQKEVSFTDIMMVHRYTYVVKTSANGSAGIIYYRELCTNVTSRV